STCRRPRRTLPRSSCPACCPGSASPVGPHPPGSPTPTSSSPSPSDSWTSTTCWESREQRGGGVHRRRHCLPPSPRRTHLRPHSSTQGAAVSLTDRIPALKGTGRRRAVDKVSELRAETRRLRTLIAGAGDAFALLHQQLAEAHGKQAEAEETVVQQQATIDDLTAERDSWRDDALAHRARFGPQIAAEANANRVSVPSWVRDTSDPADQATEPQGINVRPLWAAAEAGLLRAVTDPGEVP